MTIVHIVSEGFHYARKCRSLWLFGLFVGLTGGGSGGGGNGSQGHSLGLAAPAGADAVAGFPIALIVPLILVAAVALFVLRFVGEGALIEGIVLARKGGAMTVRDGFRAGWRHWGVLVRIAVIYVAVLIATLGVLVAACVIVFKTLGLFSAIALAIPAVFVAVPWVITLYLVQAFAARIAVLENRTALDAIAKARLFLHGRIGHGLRVMVAGLVGSLAMAVLAAVTMGPVALLMVALMPVIGFFPVIAVAGLVLGPVALLFSAILGTYRSSIWTIGYLES